ncbi:hypothetical protein V6V47_28605 [Micromonospora sp. CPCC 205539]|uniref:hypothetical protein n=1 Tax=Micromonospora sp. CPCC 205539 TaxID=3122408 RepID=UPI002FF23B34
MAVRPDGAAKSWSAARVLASAPWVVVLVGVCVLTVLLVVALLSFRTREREGAPQAAPPAFLPTVPAAVSSTTGSNPSGVERRTASPQPSRSSRTPSPRTTTGSPAPGRTTTPTASVAPLGPTGGTVGARYQVGTDGWDGTDAVLTVTNGSAKAVDWRAELTFDDDTWGLRVSGGSGASVWSHGDGEFVLRGTRSLGPGETHTMRLRVGWTRSAERPARCTVNGVVCRLG